MDHLEDTVKEMNDILSLKKSNITLPAVYMNYLSQFGGFSDGATIIYNMNEIEERNSYMRIDKTHQGYVAIGDDGGGLVFLMKQELDAKEVQVIRMLQTDLSKPYQVIHDFTDWYENQFPIQAENNEENIYLSECVDIVLMKAPEEGLKGLLKIKKSLETQYSAKELLRMTRELPVVLKKDLTRIKAQRMIANTGVEDLFELREKNY